MAEAIDSSLFFFYPHGMDATVQNRSFRIRLYVREKESIGSFRSRYIYARGDTQEDTPSVGILRNSKLCFCTHKTEIASCTFVCTKA